MKRILIVLLILFTITKAHAQTWSTTGSGTITVGTVMNVVLSNQAATPSFTSAANYQNGKTTLNYTTVAVKSNVDWIISVKAQSTFFTPQTVGASTDMPATVLGFRVNGNPSFTTMTTTSQTLKMGSNGNAAFAGNTFNIDMFFNPGFNYAGGLYNIGLLYTLTAQ